MKKLQNQLRYVLKIEGWIHIIFTLLWSYYLNHRDRASDVRCQQYSKTNTMEKKNYIILWIWTTRNYSLKMSKNFVVLYFYHNICSSFWSCQHNYCDFLFCFYLQFYLTTAVKSWNTITIKKVKISLPI
jgi:hypothetical protein